MSDFNSVLTRAFAVAPEPADDGFSVRVSAAVARRERSARIFAGIQGVGIALAGLAVAYGAYVFATTAGGAMLSDAGLEFARAQGVLAPSVSNQAQDWMQSLGLGLTQILLIAAALSGGAVAYRASQD